MNATTATVPVNSAAYGRLNADAALRRRLQEGGQALARQLGFEHFARVVDGL